MKIFLLRFITVIYFCPLYHLLLYSVFLLTRLMFCFSHLPYIYLIGHLVFSIWLLFWSFLALCLNLLKKKNTKSISDNRFECIEDDNDSAQVIILSSQSAVWLDWAQFWFWVWGQCTPVSFLTADYSERHCPVAAAVLHTPCRCQNLPAIPSTHSSSSACQSDSGQEGRCGRHLPIV